MRQVALAFLFVALASTVASQNLVYGLAESALLDTLQQEAINIDAQAFWLGVNNQFGLATGNQVKACGATVIPALSLLQGVGNAIGSLKWDIAFEYSDQVTQALDAFKSECEETYDSYVAYFAAAASAYNTDQSAFFHQAIQNLKADKIEAIMKVIDVALEIYDQKDSGAGESFGALIQIALSSYLPSEAKY